MRCSVLFTYVLLTTLASTYELIIQDGEQPAYASWLHGDWKEDFHPQQLPFKDLQSGCICRVKPFSYLLCYGARLCYRFPSNLTLPRHVYDFQLKTSAVTTIHKTNLKNYHMLTSLLLDGNNNLEFIESGAFQEMVNLKNLSISYNKELKTLFPGTFEGLVNLEVLMLVRNGFENIYDGTAALQSRYLPYLKTLILNENAFQEVPEDAFSGLADSQVHEIELVLCQIQKLSPRAFNGFRHLAALRLGDNLISEDDLSLLLRELNVTGIPLQLLNLFNFGLRNGEKLTELLEILADIKVRHLVLSRNHIESLSTDVFPRMPSLQVLDVREVSAVNVEDDTLDLDNFPNLRVLMMSGNKLPGVQPGVLQSQLSVLDLSENSGTSFSQSYFDVDTHSFSAMPNLKILDLSYNRMSSIKNSTFNSLTNLEVLGLKNVTVFFVAPGAFSPMKNLKILNLEYNPNSPFNLFRYSVFDGLENLETLYLGHCNIAAFDNPTIFRDLKNLKYLSLKDNELTTLSLPLIYPLVSLVGLDVSENMIRPWTSRRRFTNHTNLKILLLASNRLNSITVPMMEDFSNLSRLDISHNAYFCDCWAFNYTMTWLKDHDLFANETAVSSRENLCSAPGEWKDRRIVEFLDSSDSCFGEDRHAVTTTVYWVMGVVAAVSICLGVFSYFYRWHVRYWIFLLRMFVYRQHGWFLKSNKVHPGDYKYDVFVSYSHEDRNFIVSLVAMLENHPPFLKLCVYERDFEIGSLLSETVLEKVSSSRNTLLVVSNAFAKSQWCMWELQLAESHRIFFKSCLKEGGAKDPLVMIKLGPIADCNLTPTLKFLLKSRIYLEWDHDSKKQVIFWEKLRNKLAPPTRKTIGADNKKPTLAP